MVFCGLALLPSAGEKSSLTMEFTSSTASAAWDSSASSFSVRRRWDRVLCVKLRRRQDKNAC